MIKAVVLDLDDTACLTEAVCYEMENEVLGQMGRGPMSREVHLKTWGKPLFEAILERSPGVDVEAFKNVYHPIITEYTQTGKLDAIPGENYKAMDELISMGKLLLVLTSRTHTELKHLLESDHLLAKRVEAFYYRDNTAYHKPDPRAFDELLATHGLEPSECVYIGDSVGDAQSAKGAGLHFIASLESGLRQESDFEGLAVDLFVPRFIDIPMAVRELDSSTPTR